MMIRFLLAAALAIPTTAQAQKAPTVEAPAGALRGTRDGAVNVFRGIPYAAAPAGARRWQPPAPAARWDGVRDAAKFGPVCHQPAQRQRSIYSENLPAMSEDCLSLNIWAPAQAKGAPVFVWIHGGALVSGSGRQSMYDGAAMAKRAGMVVVTINYRLGVLGYLAHPGLSTESADKVSGNYGLLDQIAALRWVKDNAAAFGGDPANVTIAGESAGALSVMYLLAAPEARGLFARAIVQSGYMVSAPELRGTRHGDLPAEAIGATLMGKLGAADVAAMRAKDAQELVEGAARAAYFPFPTVDGRHVPDQLVAIFDRGEQARVPVLAGFNSGEIRSLRYLAPPAPASRAAYDAAVRERYGDLADAFLRLYPGNDLAEAVLLPPRDALYGWTAERLARSQTRAGVPGYLYYFDHSYPAADAFNLRGFHAAEIPYMFGNIALTPEFWPRIPDTAQERRLSQAMLDYWASFARDGSPRATGAPAWQPYGAARAYMAFSGEPRPGTRLMPGMFEFNETVVCRRRAAGGIPWHWNVGIISPPIPAGVPPCR
ncbi:carboxylesterase/lipase family protein [Sphingomonas sp.]|uniref:carboxylesterase/lipase family protein n=1 Tax=Sphingomonas sp. TaxID=28214 RepID=UPI002DD6723A|nr:carboxylesterase family protein [Sphingomonas sp.]